MGILAARRADPSRVPTPALPPPLPAEAPVPDHKDRIRALKDAARRRGPPADVRRICDLPVVHRISQEEADAYSLNEVLATAYDDPLRPFRLRAIQADAVLSYDAYTGPFVTARVGGGKTLIALMCLARAHAAGARRTAYFVPSSAYSQLTDPKRGDIRWARGKVPLDGVQFHYLKAAPTKRAALASSGWNGCYVIPYSLLSQPGASEMLDAIAPEFIVVDEAHRLRNRKSARTKRVITYLETRAENGFDVRLMLMSGSITSKSIKDYQHLIRLCLLENSPLPLSVQVADDWGAVLDAKASPSASAKSELLPLIEWARRNFPHEQIEDDVAGFRKAFQVRFTSAPGVVATGADELGITLIMHNDPAPLDKTSEPAKRLLKLLEDVDGGLTPNGDEIEHAIHAYKWRYELSAGFYNERFWNEGKHTTAILERSRAYHEAVNDYHRALRAWFDDRHIPGLDTPLLVGAEIAKHGAKRVGEPLARAWQQARDLDFEGRVDRDSRVVRVCDYKIRHAVRWASALEKGTGALVWFYHNAVGEWLYEAMREAGLDCLWCPAGANELVLAESSANKILILSTMAHSEAKNLQHFHEQMYVQWPRSAITAEQSLGRTHRPPAEGQEPPDELVVVRNDTLEFDHQNFAACLNDAVYIHETIGSDQKLVYATYEPFPPVYDSNWLRQNGFRSKKLNDAQRALLRERFGTDGGRLQGE